MVVERPLSYIPYRPRPCQRRGQCPVELVAAKPKRNETLTASIAARHTNNSLSSPWRVAHVVEESGAERGTIVAGAVSAVQSIPMHAADMDKGWLSRYPAKPGAGRFPMSWSSGR